MDKCQATKFASLKGGRGREGGGSGADLMERGSPGRENERKSKRVTERDEHAKEKQGL